jgi:hypothetical protein
MKDTASFLLVSLVFGLGAFAIAASPNVMPNKEGLAQCMVLHPERYCRIANGFPVEPLRDSKSLRASAPLDSSAK